MPGIAYVNGELAPLDRCRISVLDRGFLFGDGVYEVMPVYGGRAFRLPEHLRRLGESLAQARIEDPLTASEWTRSIQELIDENGGGDLSVYIQVTRGSAPRRDHAFPAGTRPTVFMMVTPSVPQGALEDVRGVSAVTLPDNRWTRCNIKSIGLLPNVLLKQEALDAGAEEAILIRDGCVTECAAANVFVVADGEVLTPPKSDLLLGGITRELVIELAQRDGLPCFERDVPESLLRRADEIWITSSRREVVPVTELDASPVGSGDVGPVWREVAVRFRRYKAELR